LHRCGTSLHGTTAQFCMSSVSDYSLLYETSLKEYKCSKANKILLYTYTNHYRRIQVLGHRQGGHCYGGRNKIKDLSSTLMTFSKPIPQQLLACDISFTASSPVSNTDLHCTGCTNDCTIFHTMGIIDYIGIQALLRTSYAKFQKFQAPNPLSRTFQGTERFKKF